jgi:hypothetical protein
MIFDFQGNLPLTLLSFPHSPVERPKLSGCHSEIVNAGHRAPYCKGDNDWHYLAFCLHGEMLPQW